MTGPWFLMIAIIWSLVFTATEVWFVLNILVEDFNLEYFEAAVFYIL